MAGIGDSWGTKEELLHPRGPDGRWIRKGGIAKSIINAVLGFLANFRPRTFQNKNQSTQYLHNISRRQGKKRFGSADLRRLYDLPNANEDLQDGVIDNPSTKQFVDMMDRTETELPDDLILTTILPTEAFGFSAQTATGTNSDTDPGIRGVSGKLGADRGYLTMVIGNADDAVPVPAGSVRLIVAAPKGTKVNIPGGSSSDPTLFLTRGQPLRITKIKPDGAGGWHMYATAAEPKGGEVPTPIGGPRGLQRPSTQERESAIRELGRISAKREGRPDEVAEQADIEARQRAAEANAQATPTPSPQQEAERKRVEALTQQPAPGEPPPRTEAPVGRVGEPGAPAPGGAPAQTPEATVPSRAVDLRLAVRDAGIPSPSAGSRRRLWNEHYLGVASGKKDPIDAVRELDRDIEVLRNGGEPGGAVRGGLDEDRPKDVESYQKLRDLIAQEYGLPGAPRREERTEAGLPKLARGGKTRMSQREQEAEERNRAAGASEAVPAPTPVKAPTKKAAKKAAAGPVRTKDQEDRILSQASKLSGPARNSEEERLLGEAEAIRARRAGAPVPTPSPVKALRSPTWTPARLKPEERRDYNDLSTEEQGEYRKFRRAGNGHGDALQSAQDAVAAKKAPAKMGGRSTGGTFIGNLPAPESEQGPDLDKMTKQELIAEAGRRGVTARESWTKDRIKKEIRDREKLADEADEQFRRDMAKELKAEFFEEEQEAQMERAVKERVPEAPAPAKKVAKKAAPALSDQETRIRELFEGDKPTVGQLREYARINGMEPGDAIVSQGFMKPLSRMKREELIGLILTGNESERRFTGDRSVGGLPNTSTLRQQIIHTPENKRGDLLDGVLAPLTQPQRRRVAQELGVKGQGRATHQGQVLDAIMEHFRGAVPEGEGAPEAPAPVKKAAKVAVPGAAPGRIDRVGPRDINVGDEILIEAGPSKGTSRGRVARIERSGGKGSNNRYEFFNEDGEMFRSMAPNGKTNVRRGDVAPEPGAAPVKKAAKAAAPDKVQVARARQEEIFEAKKFADTAAELDQLITDDVSDKSILSRFDQATKNEGTTGSAMDVVRARLEAGDRDGARREMRRILDANGVQPTGNAGDIVPFNRREHAEIAGTTIADGDMVRIVRPGHRTRIRDEDIDLGRSVVEPATPEEVARVTKAKQLVPEGSVPGTRTDTPVDNAPRKRELRQAWIAADIQPPPGPVRTQTEEIRDKLLNGDVTPEEGIRMMESEISMNKEDLAELDAHLREADLTDRERKEFQDRAVKLTDGIREQEKASKFLRLYFKDEAPVVSLKEAKEVDPVSYEFLKDATPDDMREAAKEAGLDAPSGDTADEMFTDLLKQVARNELARRAAKKVAKKVAPARAAKKAAPEVPRDKERVDARLLAEGIEGLDKETLAEIQRAFDGDPVPGSGKNPTPARIAEWLDFKARGFESTAVILHGDWGDPDTQFPERAIERKQAYDREIGRARALQELAGRVRGVRRRSFKKAAPSTPRVEAAEAKVDDLQKRIIDQALEGLQGAKSRDKGDDALEGLTTGELGRLADAAGIPRQRTKRGMRDAILDRFVGPEQGPDLDAIFERLSSFEDPPTREDAAAMVAPLNKAQLLDLAQRASIPGARSKNMTQLRREIVEGTAGARRDSIATRGFRGARPGLGDVQGRPDLPTVIPEPAAPRTPSLSRRASGAGIATPSRMFSDVDSAVSDADIRLRNGESHTDVARRLRERAARVAKADIMEEGRRFPTELDRDTLLSIRKSNADYLRRVATHVQQEGKATKAIPAKKAAPRASAPEVDAQIQTVYQDLADRPGAWVPLADVRERLSGMDRADVDAALERLAVQPGIHVIPWDNRKALTDRDRAASVRIGGDDAHAIRIEAPTPVKKVAPAKKAAPPAPAAPSPSRTGTSPVGGTKSTAPEIKNDWGMLGTGGDVEFHDDGVIGQRLRQMGDDRLMDVDGEPLSNVIGKLATKAVRGEISQEQLLDNLQRLAQRLPEGSAGRRGINSMIKDLDAPSRPMPDLPDGTPAPFRTAIEKLLQIPVAREAVDRPGFHRDREDSEVDKLLRLIQDFHEGRAGGLRMVMEIQDIRGSLPHESQEGRFEADRVLRDLHAELDRMYKNPELRPQLMRREPGTPAAKKATPRLTAIPGGGTGGRRKRPKLTVVRDEQGEFAVAWV